MNVQRLRQLEQRADQGEWFADDLIAGVTAGFACGVFSPQDRVALAGWETAELFAEVRNALPHLLNIAEAAQQLDLPTLHGGLGWMRSETRTSDEGDELDRLADALARFEQA